MPLPSNQPSLTPRNVVRETPLNSIFTRSNNATPQGRKASFAPPSSQRKPVSTVLRLPTEPEDAHITGATRSLTRRLLALNVRQVS
jgi:hypothetical protein